MGYMYTRNIGKASMPRKKMNPFSFSLACTFIIKGLYLIGPWINKALDFSKVFNSTL